MRALVAVCLFAFPITTFGNERDLPRWSKPIDGLRGKVELKVESEVNETPIMACYLTLKNEAKIVNPKTVAWDNSKFEVVVVDQDGKEVAQATGPYSGGRRFSANLVIPFDSSITMNVSQSGLGIPKAQRALLDFGPHHCWIIPAGDQGKYYLRSKLVIKKGSRDEWFGELELPDVLIPTQM